MKYLIPLALIATLFFACNPAPNKDDIVEMIIAKDYNSLTEVINSEAFTDKKIVMGEIINPTLFEEILLAFAFSDTIYVDTAKIYLPFKDIKVAQFVTHHILNRGGKVPSGFNNYVETAILENSDRLFSIQDQKLLIKKNPELKMLAKKHVYDKALETEVRNENQILKLITLAEINPPNDLLSRLEMLSTEIESMKATHVAEQEEIARLGEEIKGLDDREEMLKEDNTQVIEARRESYEFGGYMIAHKMTIASADVYEVRGRISNKTYLLTTKEAKFTSKGRFNLKVYPGESIPMKLTNEYGGFTRDIPVIIEYTDRLNEQFEEYWKEYQEIRTERNSSQNRLKTLENKRDEFETKLTSKKENLTDIKLQLAEWVKSN
ncbi:MAG: hypothetical protein ABJR05_14540 [Balneola sp.]